jgi:hypothetical protein
VEVVPANNDGSVHLSTVACSSNNSASDRNCSSEWALLVNVGACIKQKFNNLANAYTYYPNMWLIIWQTLTVYHELSVYKIEVKSGAMIKIMPYHGCCFFINNTQP